MLKVFSTLFVGLTAIITSFEIQGEELKPTYYLDALGISYTRTVFITRSPDFSHSGTGEYHLKGYGNYYLGKFMLSRGPTRIGTIIYERHANAGEIYGENNWREIADTTYQWSIAKHGLVSYFPVVVEFMLYSRRAGLGNVSLISYLKGSLWASGKRDEDYATPIAGRRPRYFYKAYNLPFSYFDAGVYLSLNLLRFVPVWFQLGIMRLDYKFHVPEPFKNLVPNSISWHFYFSYGISLAYCR